MENSTPNFTQLPGEVVELIKSKYPGVQVLLLVTDEEGTEATSLAHGDGITLATILHGFLNSKGGEDISDLMDVMNLMD